MPTVSALNLDAENDGKDTYKKIMDTKTRSKFGTTNIVASMSACSAETNTRWLYLKCE
jgi:hypothetical protein